MPTITITKVAGLVLGAVACSVLLITPRISRPAGVLDASLTLTASPTGELGIAPKGVLVRSGRLAPDAAPVRTPLTVRNLTGVPLAVTLAARPVSGDLDDTVRLRITDRARVLFDGPVGALRSGSRPLALGLGAAVTLRVSARLLPGAGPAFQGRSDEVGLELHSAKAVLAP